VVGTLWNELVPDRDRWWGPYGSSWFRIGIGGGDFMDQVGTG
jgi:hypothetical protein